jgi:mono/diheme cytochrome c family protein
MQKIAIGLGLIIVGLGLLPHSDAKEHRHKADGKEIFAQNCAGCHQAGDNQVNLNKPVAGSDKLQTLALFKQYLSAPPGHMPYYQHVVNDKKTLEALYSYCKGLPKVPFKRASIRDSRIES